MGKVYPIQKPIINYSDTLFVYKFHEGEIRRHAVTDLLWYLCIPVR